MRKFLLGLLFAAVLGCLPADAQAPGRVATTADALLAEPVFFHGRQVAIRGAVVQSGAVTRLLAEDAGATGGTPKTHPLFVYWRQQPPRSDGEIRGEFWDLGRLREDDPRFSAYDLRPVLEAASGGRWPARDELFVLLGATLIDAPEPADPTIRSIAMSPRRFADRAVTLTGRFRGRNLYGDVPSALNRSRWDFVVQSADAAVWVSGLRPRGRGFELDPGAKVDTNRWVQVSGTVRVEGSRVWMDGEAIELTAAPKETEVELPPPPVVKEAPPAVIFSAPLADDTDVGTGTTVRIQFSRDMNARSFAGQVRVSYTGKPAPGAPVPEPPAVAATYHEGNRALELKFAKPLERFQTVRIELLEGITAIDGQPLAPWSISFSTGSR